MAFGLEATMPIEFQVPSLRVQVTERLHESQLEQYRLEQLLELGEHRVASMAQLEQHQRQCKAFVDRHQKGTKKALTTGARLSNTARGNAMEITVPMDRSVLDYRRV